MLSGVVDFATERLLFAGGFASRTIFATEALVGLRLTELVDDGIEVGRGPALDVALEFRVKTESRSSVRLPLESTWLEVKKSRRRGMVASLVSWKHLVGLLGVNAWEWNDREAGAANFDNEVRMMQVALPYH